MDWLLVILLFGLCAVLVVRLERLGEVSYTGRFVVHDGDTVSRDGRRMRLRGIDAFELDQSCERDGGSYACGRVASAALKEMMSTATVSCNGAGQDRYGRLLVTCRTADHDINRAMVENGWALAYGRYDDAERIARAQRRGAWEGAFDRPSDWRAGRGGPDEQRHDLWSDLMAWLRGFFERLKPGGDGDEAL